MASSTTPRETRFNRSGSAGLRTMHAIGLGALS